VPAWRGSAVGRGTASGSVPSVVVAAMQLLAHLAKQLPAGPGALHADVQAAGNGNRGGRRQPAARGRLGVGGGMRTESCRVSCHSGTGDALAKLVAVGVSRGVPGTSDSKTVLGSWQIIRYPVASWFLLGLLGSS